MPTIVVFRACDEIVQHKTYDLCGDPKVIYSKLKNSIFVNARILLTFYEELSFEIYHKDGYLFSTPIQSLNMDIQLDNLNQQLYTTKSFLREICKI